MDSEQIAKLCKGYDSTAEPSVTIELATYRATLEVAYQLAILNERLDGVIQNRIPQVRVMVEPGEWPIQVEERRK